MPRCRYQQTTPRSWEPTEAICLVWTVNSLLSLTGSSLGTFTYTAGDDINDRPIYRQSGGNAYFAVKTTTYPSLPNWIGSNTATTNPGDGSGFIFEMDYKNPKCPHAVSNWNVYFNGETVHDTTFKFECAVGKCLNIAVSYLLYSVIVKIVPPRSPQLPQGPLWAGTTVWALALWSPTPALRDRNFTPR